MIIDATNLILGRLSSFAAKKALQGENVDIINAEKSVISGNKVDIFENYKRFREMGGPFHGPFSPRKADVIVRRTIRGMLPHKQPRGKEAFKRIRCFIGVPKDFEGKKFETIKEANRTNLTKTTSYLTIQQVSRKLGAKI
ncbi:50S ribosomal protein L13 [Candidatus Woesearchaeota archaeon]|nr:50S ribosomal protein L13 [Candidatus Woesearchaeota archaeon]